mmetsp:Transcript_40925/g.96039  ORF Transcript_40925/g.96039 Transcript_40925/m.96039 type:complete len:87 (-) Transcript_40925:449-709(-)
MDHQCALVQFLVIAHHPLIVLFWEHPEILIHGLESPDQIRGLEVSQLSKVVLQGPLLADTQWIRCSECSPLWTESTGYGQTYSPPP